MSGLPKISEAEWTVIKILWEKSPQTANEIVEVLIGSDWNPQTIKTLINRLLNKKAIGFEKQGRRYLYYPLVNEDACVRQEAKSLARRMGTGILKPILAEFLEEQVLSKEDIQELSMMLEQKKRAGKKDKGKP